MTAVTALREKLVAAFSGTNWQTDARASTLTPLFETSRAGSYSKLFCQKTTSLACFRAGSAGVLEQDSYSQAELGRPTLRLPILDKCATCHYSSGKVHLFKLTKNNKRKTRERQRKVAEKDLRIKEAKHCNMQLPSPPTLLLPPCHNNCHNHLPDMIFVKTFTPTDFPLFRNLPKKSGNSRHFRPKISYFIIFTRRIGIDKTKTTHL